MELTQTRLSLQTGLGYLESSGSHLRDQSLESLAFLFSYLSSLAGRVLEPG